MNIKGTQERTFTLELSQEGEKRTYSASLSSEQSVERGFGTEILRHDADSIDMSRASRGLPLLFNHDINEPLGKVKNIRLEGDKLRGDLVWGKRAKAQEMKAEVDADLLGDISIRYNIDEYEIDTDKRGHDTVTVTRWTPLEGSLVTVAADSSVGIGRSRDTGISREIVMSDEEDTGVAGKETAGNSTVTTLRGKQKQTADRAAKGAIAAERSRITEIQDLFAGLNERFQGDEADDLRDDCIVKGISVDGSRRLVFDLINDSVGEQTVSANRSADSQNGGTRAVRDPFVQAGADAGDKMVDGVTRSIEARAGLLSKDETAKESSSEFKGQTLSELARAVGTRQGLNLRGLNSYQMLGEVLKHGGRRDIGLGTEDFTGILANVANKSLLMGWETANTTYRQWVRIGNLSDFKRANRTALSGMELLDVIPENAEYKYGKTADRTEYITAVKYGKLFSISREALINDDLNAFTAIPQNQGRAADLTINKAVYDSLGLASGVGPTLNQDSVALFATAHGNYTATSGGITVANLEVGRSAMAVQLDPTNSMPLNIQPSYLLVPSALSSAAKILVASEKDPVGSTNAIGGATTPNQFHNAFTVITEAYLDSGVTDGATAWYLIANQNTTDTYEVGFLNGQQSPYLESKNGWDVDGVEYKVRIEAGIAALDYRGMYRKKGA